MLNEKEALGLNYAEGDGWFAAQGDAVKLMRQMPEAWAHLTVTSVPFESLLTYSASDYDFGNCRNSEEFFGQFSVFVDALRRITIPGRLAAVHCMILPSTKTRDGFIGLKDFRGDVVRAFERGGWIFHSETGIWKCPVVAVTRTKALGLLHKTLKKDSTMSRTGILDYLCVFRSPGVNPEPVTHTDETFPVPKWQQYASPIWKVDPTDMPLPAPFWDDIDQTETLQTRLARDESDEAHLCALQTQVIERAIELWSNPGDRVFDPFGGIGSTPYVALKMGRRAGMCELKDSYWQQAVKNLRSSTSQLSLFDKVSNG